MEKAKNVVEFYLFCNELKHLIRTGWRDWHVDSDRLESVAEHIYGVEMLAIAIYSEYDFDIDLKKVVMMLALHELEEIVIGDLTQFQISREEKARLGHEAVRDVLAPLTIHDDLEKFVFEFDERKTKEARFAYFCDKLECDIQAKLYDLDGAVSLEKQEDNVSFYDQRVQELLSTDSSWSTMWLTFSQEKYHYDPEFLEISNYVLEHDLNVEKKKLKEIQKK